MTLFESLQRDFCPTLDSSLIAALLVEIESDNDGNAVTPTKDQIDSLRSTLNELSLQADEAQQSEFSDVQFTSQFDETISSWTTPDAGPSRSSGSSESSLQSFNTPLGYLQATFPDVPTSQLKKTLLDAQKDDKDMWHIVEDLLSEELIREKVERGLDALDDEECYDFDENAVEWETVERKVHVTPSKKKNQPRPKKIAVSDVRQQHHIHNQRHQRNGSVSTPVSPGPSADPWMQVTSLSSHLSSLLPPHPPSTFSSFFHSPKHTTSYDALRACLASLCKSTDDDTHASVLFNLLDIILPEYGDCDAELLSRVTSDAQLAVAVTDGDGDAALDIFSVLRDLDSDASLGLTHLPAPQPSSFNPKQNGTSVWKPLAHPSDIRPPPEKHREKPPPPPNTPNKPSPYQWQAVPQRTKVPRGPHPLAHHIPAYSRDVNGMKTNRYSRSRSYPYSGSLSGDAGFRQRMSMAMAKRDQALKDATRMWQKGNAKNRGGEVAVYYAERAKELEQVAREEMLSVAREIVLSKRRTHGNQDTIDLHGTTVSEAIVIVKEILNDRASTISQGRSSVLFVHVSLLAQLLPLLALLPLFDFVTALRHFAQNSTSTSAPSFFYLIPRLRALSQRPPTCLEFEAKPMKIITGRGAHSAGQVSVLKPAVRKALEEDGWVVGTWDAGLVVRSRRT
ncbi:hypothetical protein NLJ89_g3418 [Agrocybe chaxingu]|uniref:Smr domain-containing protein n=1 Tax=Agrocybe chaxingu TaxID=84603 RepID=A0A9W8MWW6_9AGAR|nr:hypothetical protein NLJ89_g3418 [Agrocybe chaxingu]